MQRLQRVPVLAAGALLFRQARLCIEPAGALTMQPWYDKCADTCVLPEQTGLMHSLTTMHINEWVELINMLHVDTFAEMAAEMRERYQENNRNSSPVLIIHNTLEVRRTYIKIQT